MGDERNTLRFVLVRGFFTAEATFGLFGLEDGAPFAVTLERDRDNNRASTDDTPGACIPAGTYVCRRVKSPKFGDTFEVTGVPGRLHILLHAANLPRELRGCIALGDGLDPVNGQDGIINSRDAMAEFFAIVKGHDRFTLTIIDAR